MDFVVEELPTPTSRLSPAPTHEIRRIKSSSALSGPSSSSSSPATPNPAASAEKVPTKWEHALGEAQYFAGGLLSRPVESTRHYSIIRHSHALIWYRGPSTSVTITILSDGELPPTRTMWLQQKGYSGSAGMSLKALMGTKGDWTDVTPATRADVQDIPPQEERGIQRDLKRFAKKASGRQKKHLARETHIVRIPAATEDGYFRIVLCAGEDGSKVLCGCPVFRVASTSSDISVVRGASVRTMPIEMGVKVGSTVAQTFVKKYTGVAGAVVQSGAGRVAANATVKKATMVGRTVVKTTKLDQAVSESWRNGQAGRYDPMVEVHDGSHFEVIGSDDGPEAPFPEMFDGRVVRATGRSTDELGIPTANLSGVRDDVKMRWRGVYAAWASIVPAKGSSMEGLSYDWHEAVVTVGPLRHAAPDVVLKNRVTVHFITDFEGATFYDAKVRVMLMGFLHPPAGKEDDPDDIIRQHASDLQTVLASLGRDAWACERFLDSSHRGGFSLGDATGAVQERVDRMPMHWVGMRSEGAAMRDKVYGKGGLWVAR